MKKTFTIVMAMAFAITLIIATTKEGGGGEEEVAAKVNDDSKTSSRDISLPEKKSAPVKRVSRFLAQENPRAKFHCKKDYSICYAEGSPGSTCCNNKCIDLKTDRHNCGACKKKCKYTDWCCNGKCVNLSFDKRHCGNCNTKCMPGGYCIYGMCDYA